MRRHLLIAATLFTSCLHSAHAEGYVQLRNTIASRVKYVGGPGAPGDLPTTIRANFAVFVVSSNGSTTLALPLGTSSTTSAGIIDVPTPVSIPGTEEGQVVFLQIRGWDAAFGADWWAARSAGALFGETDRRYVTLGSSNAPATIWQSATATNPNRFNPMTMGSFHEPVYFTINNVSAAEDNAGTSQAYFRVSRGSFPSWSSTDYPARVSFATRDGTAIAGQDYVSTNGTIDFAPGERTRTIAVELTADLAPEPDESFKVILSNPVYGALFVPLTRAPASLPSHAWSNCACKIQTLP